MYVKSVMMSVHANFYCWYMGPSYSIWYLQGLLWTNGPGEVILGIKQSSFPLVCKIYLLCTLAGKMWGRTHSMYICLEIDLWLLCLLCSLYFRRFHYKHPFRMVPCRWHVIDLKIDLKIDCPWLIFSKYWF